MQPTAACPARHTGRNVSPLCPIHRAVDPVMACVVILIFCWASLRSLCAIETSHLEKGLGRATGLKAQCLIPSSSLQAANPSSALSRLVPVTSPASTGSQQAINILKEQNRLLTKVSGGGDGGDALGGAEKGRGWNRAEEGMTSSVQEQGSVPSAWPDLVIPEKGVWAACEGPLAHNCAQLCPAVCWVSQWQG